MFFAIDAMLLAQGSSRPQYIFEPTPRVVEQGRDLRIAVRASGDLFLRRVDGSDLWLQTSFDGGDSFDKGLRVNDIGEVASHAESTPQMIGLDGSDRNPRKPGTGPVGCAGSISSILASSQQLRLGLKLEFLGSAI